jgi:endonuclease-8
MQNLYAGAYLMEGPSLKAIAEKISCIEGLLIYEVSGNTKAGKERLGGKRVTRIYTVGKRLVIETDHLAVVIHFLMFGSYRLNERRENMAPRLSLSFNGNELNFYNCSVKILSKSELEELDLRSDILNPEFDREKAMDEIKGYVGLIADLLLDQAVFGGVGNIIKNEALYGAAIHPESISKNIPDERVMALNEETVRFSREFLDLKRVNKPLKPILHVYRKKICERCGSAIQRKKTGERKRMSFFCPSCQVVY